MADIFDFLENNFWLLLGFASLWVVAWSTYFAWRRHQHGPTHPPFSEYDVLFDERFASGFSRKNLFTRCFGAHNSLVVRVLHDALLIEPIVYYKWLMPVGFNDLEHYVQRTDIISVNAGSVVGHETVQIQFHANDGQRRTIELVLRNPQEFKAALSA